MSSSPRAQHLQDADSLVLLNLCLLVWRRYVPVTNRHLVMPLRTSVIVDSTDYQTGWVSPILRESIFRYLSVDFPRASLCRYFDQCSFTAFLTCVFHCSFDSSLTLKSRT